MVDGLVRNKGESSKKLRCDNAAIEKGKQLPKFRKTKTPVSLLPVRMLSASSSTFTWFFSAMRPMIHLERPYC